MLVILTTHPIQYQVPVWQALAREGSVPFEVWYLSRHGARPSWDRGFQRSFAWDLDLTTGHPHRFLPGAEKPLGGFWTTRLPGRFGARLRRAGARVLWVQGWQVAAYWQALAAARRAGVETWLRGDSNDLRESTWPRRAARHCVLGPFLRRADRLLYVGSANRRLYRALGVPESRLAPAPHAVDNDRFARQAAALRPHREAIRKAWNVPADAFCLLFAGKLEPKKRPLDLVAAADRLRARRPACPVHLLVAGSGELGPLLRERCRVVFDAEDPASAGAAESDGGRPPASFVGLLSQREISRAFVAADALVLPSDPRETWGLVVNEAMASGLPCVTSDACGCAEDLVAPLGEAFRFRLGDVDLLAEALERVRTAPPDPEALRARIDGFHLRHAVATVVGLFGGEGDSEGRGSPGQDLADRLATANAGHGDLRG